jgi:hypothetical protein
MEIGPKTKALGAAGRPVASQQQESYAQHINNLGIILLNNMWANCGLNVNISHGGF